MTNLNAKHKYDISLELNQDVQNIVRATYFACESDSKSSQKCDDGGFDCGGTLGSAGSFGGTLGTFGCFGCCC
ncbi:MAG: hypothetical protein JKX98_12445 [Alcanivoracaceae bacterium]|nr:hypothetical protein [Alcanivoracaceae bacterium]